ncbi:Holliday junction branch migration protein RuvA [Fulvivirga sedimenti]|uniref:Holliday junction branch migration complex subunit RuvA n=1 Tax=Fulvivirga sedimenti TaxID=2879465 RepID=A0A9X1L2D9_9BACT|nr:Holliday junction branch migration protein RuvA [Fulvivirga sedimenti]MCA6078076.1 Holliday junction branch migration protein RuvA [Fulvivirga sedimenti]
MIAYLKGKFIETEPTHVLIDVQGVGYHVHISLHTFTEIKEKKEGLIHTHLHIKEDAHTLFGFSGKGERSMFLALLSISGVGPSTAIMVLSSLNVSELKTAIVQGDVRTIQSVKGIGAKTAQRIILELKDKLIKSDDFEAESQLISHSHNTLKSEALSALTTLGISKNAAEKSVETILKNSGNTITLEELIKLALKTT